MGQSATKEEPMVRDRIFVTGMPGSGETTLLYWLKHGEVDSMDQNSLLYPPEHSSNYNGFEVYNQGSSFGGRDPWRQILRYFQKFALAFVFLVDSTDTENWQWAKVRMQIMLVEGKELNDAIIAVVANKQDLPGAKSLEEIEEILSIDLDGEKRRFKVFPMVATKGEGVSECFDWVVAQIKEKQTIKAAVEPWKDVAGDMTKDGKTGLKLVKKNWKKVTSVLSWGCGAKSA